MIALTCVNGPWKGYSLPFILGIIPKHERPDRNTIVEAQKLDQSSDIRWSHSACSHSAWGEPAIGPPPPVAAWQQSVG